MLKKTSKCISESLAKELDDMNEVMKPLATDLAEKTWNYYTNGTSHNEDKMV